MPYKLNSEEYSLTVVQLKIQKEKRLDCFLDVNRVKHKNDHQKPRALTSLGPHLCGVRVSKLHFIPNLAISDSLVSVSDQCVFRREKFLHRTNHSGNFLSAYSKLSSFLHASRGSYPFQVRRKKPGRRGQQDGEHVWIYG